MDIADSISTDVDTHGGDVNPPSTGLTPAALPEVQKPVLAENSHTGVTTRNVPLPKELQEVKQRGRVIIDGLMTIATTYIPRAFLEQIQ